ncbi:stage II sporulation protein M [Nocardioides caldifontis]|uniref:stage II sporulation protein M n=1 Tax=Nocardioides caldifontis TaxID=2588938 RepID=UPI0011E000D1|nr:stage II sporulation protein M [Nocardioides caldifontis]
MDLDAFVSVHQDSWRRLEELGKRRRLTGAEADELVDLYQAVATHLSVIRSEAPDPTVIAYLSGILARARTRAGVGGGVSWREAGRFFTTTFPAALYRTSRWWLATLVANVVVGVAIGWWFLEHPRVEQTLVSPEEVDQLVNVDFEAYYSSYEASHFAAQVWTNNAWVAALCIALGVFGLPVVYLLWTNVLNIAVTGSIMVRHDRGDLFFGLILPHGMLELTAVFVAAGVGLRVFWSWVAPGPMSRGSSLAREGRAAVAVAMGLVVVLLVSGVIEAFVTPSGLPTWARISIGALAELAFLAYVFGPGRLAHRRGESGDVAASAREAQVAAAD